MNEILHGKRAVIFDLDDTLVYKTEETLIDNAGTALKRTGLSEKSREEILSFYRRHEWNLTLRRDWELDEDEFAAFWKNYIDYVENKQDDGTIVYRDVVPCLERLKQKNFKIAVITSATSKYLGRQIKKIGKGYFDYYACVGNHVLFPPKPDKAGFLHFLNLKQINLNPEQVIAIGNSDLDTLTARNAGVLPVLIDRGNNSYECKPSFLIKSLDELR